jgi:hypothetical protein
VCGGWHLGATQRATCQYTVVQACTHSCIPPQLRARAAVACLKPSCFKAASPLPSLSFLGQPVLPLRRPNSAQTSLAQPAALTLLPSPPFAFPPLQLYLVHLRQPPGHPVTHLHLLEASHLSGVTGDQAIPRWAGWPGGWADAAGTGAGLGDGSAGVVRVCCCHWPAERIMCACV